MAASRSGADGSTRRSTVRQSRLFPLILALLVLPSTAAAQRDPFFSAVVTFYRSLSGVYGDEGPQVTAQFAAVSAALDRWDNDIRDAERELRSKLQSTNDAQTKLQIHTLLASMYLERGRLEDAVREFDEDITIDPKRAPFHRFKGLALQAMSRPAEAAEAFRSAWLLDPEDPQNAYRLIAYRSAQTTSQDVERAVEALANVERALVRRERPSAPALFTNLRGIVDDAGGAMAFVPTAYANGFSLILEGQLERGVAALRTAISGDPLVNDPASRSEPMARGVSALRQGNVTAAIESLEMAAVSVRDSSEAHRILATAYFIGGDIAKSVQHLRDAVRLNPRDERSWLALARILDESGRSAEAEDAMRNGVAAVPGVGALRWRLSTASERLQHADDDDLLAKADQFVLLVGKAEAYAALARLAGLHLDYERVIALQQRAVLTAPNNAAAHRALGRAYVENGRATEGYADLVVALLLDPFAVETFVDLGRWHLDADQAVPAVEALERAVGMDAGNRLVVRALADALIRAGRTSDGKQRVAESERLQARAIDEDRAARAAAALRVNAEVRMEQRDYAGAIDLWRQAISLQGGSAATHLRVAEALAAVNRRDEAAAEYLKAISLNAGPDAHRRLAELYDAMGRTADASSQRATYVKRQLEDLRRRSEQGAYGF